MKKLLFACAISVSSLFSLFMLPASAQVVINGNLFQGEELAELEYLLGAPVPQGFYWLNTNTGAWGYEGDSTIQGNLFDELESRYSSEEGGRADSYYEGRAGNHTSYVSDGECAYFSTEYGSISTCD